MKRQLDYVFENCQEGGIRHDELHEVFSWISCQCPAVAVTN